MLLEVEELSVTIATAAGPLHAVQSVSFALARGQTLGIVGESGCGKSLTALALMDLLPRRATLRAKRYAIGGRDMLAASGDGIDTLRGDRVVMIFQEPMTSLNPVFTIGDQLTAVFRQHRKRAGDEARERALYLLDRVGIAAPAQRLAQFPHELSGGLRQRVMIAMALMCGPDLIIADEPTTALDVTIQAELLRLLADLQRELGMGIIFITHDLGIVSRMADSVAVMYAGELVETGTVEQIFGAPLHPYTKGLMACLPGPARTRLAPLPSIPGAVPSLVGDLRGCHFAARCPFVRQECAADVALAPRGADHPYRCVLPPRGAG
ncbi:MAG TPA: ABC transporter ATP-binding protein [Xanthobacteraceae bacterium]|nr:ABC transporter ATP-binding protein [Xanthobacteraceae bacterium]